MTKAAKPKQPDSGTDDDVFIDADALIALAQKSFSKAAQKAVKENDALGIPTHGSVKGKIVVRQPRNTTKLAPR